MDDPWNEKGERAHPLIYCIVIIICAAILLGELLPALLGVAP